MFEPYFTTFGGHFLRQSCGIEVTYFRRRRKKALGKLLPVDFEKIQELALGHTLKGYRDVPHLR